MVDSSTVEEGSPGGSTTDGSGRAETSSGRTDRIRRWWTLVIFSYMALQGAGLQMRGAVLPTLGTVFGAPEWQLGLIAPAGTFGLTAVIVVVGAVAGRVDTRKVYVVGVAGTALGILAMGLAPTFGVFLGALLIRGGMTGLARGTDRPMLSHLYPTARGRIFNFYDMAWAVGAASGPLLVAGALALNQWRLAYGALVVGFVPLIAVALWLPAPDVDGGDEPLDLAKLRSLLGRPQVQGMALGLMLSVGVEGGLFTWLPYYAQGELPASLAGLTLSVMLVAYIPGRLLTGTLVSRVGPLPILTGMVAVAVPVFWATFFVAEGLWLLAGVAGIGLLISGIYPTFLAYAMETVPEHSAPVNAIGSATSAVGIGVVPAAMGVIISGRDAAAAMELLMIPLVGALVVLVGLGVATRE